MRPVASVEPCQRNHKKRPHTPIGQQGLEAYLRVRAGKRLPQSTVKRPHRGTRFSHPEEPCSHSHCGADPSDCFRQPSESATRRRSPSSSLVGAKTGSKYGAPRHHGAVQGRRHCEVGRRGARVGASAAGAVSVSSGGGRRTTPPLLPRPFRHPRELLPPGTCVCTQEPGGVVCPRDPAGLHPGGRPQLGRRRRPQDRVHRQCGCPSLCPVVARLPVSPSWHVGEGWGCRG